MKETLAQEDLDKSASGQRPSTRFRKSAAEIYHAEPIGSTSPEWPPLSVDKRRQVHRQRWIRRAIEVPLIFVACAVVGPGRLLHSASRFEVVIFVFFAMTIYTLWEFFRDQFPSAADRNIIEDPRADDEMLVQVSVAVNGVVVGNDRGVLWRDGGLLYFYGHRSFFRIARKDLLPVTYRPRIWPVSELAITARQKIMTTHNGQRVSIGIQRLLIDPMTFRPYSDTHKLTAMLDEFDETWADPSKSSLLPPLTLDPAYGAPFGLLVCAVLWLLASAMTLPHALRDLEIAPIAFQSLVALGIVLPALRGHVCRTIMRFAQPYKAASHSTEGHASPSDQVVHE